MNQDAIALILGRKGSKGVIDKNTMQIFDKPAFSYAFSAAKKSNFVKNIFVSSDHPEILKAAKKEKFYTIERPEELCTDTALFEDALVHAYHEAKKRIDYFPNYIVVLMCNAVTISAELIDRGIEALIKDQSADSAVTVTVFNMYSPLRARKLNKNGYLDPFVPFEVFGDPSTLNCDRDSQGDVYFADMSHSICKSSSLENIDNGLLPQKWMGNKILPVHNQNGCDIDEPWQIDMSKRWITENNKK